MLIFFHFQVSDNFIFKEVMTKQWFLTSLSFLLHNEKLEEKAKEKKSAEWIDSNRTKIYACIQNENRTVYHNEAIKKIDINPRGIVDQEKQMLLCTYEYGFDFRSNSFGRLKRR